MLYNLCFYFILFLLYSFLGWLIETISCTYWKKKLVLNRGFLIGPYCPVYGTAAIIMILFLSEYKNDLVTLFFMAVVYASIVEYATSYILEKLFKARWWDYSNKRFNLDGRICLFNSLGFGILGIILINFINPVIESFLYKIPRTLFIILSIILLIIFITDVIITFTIVSKLKIKVQNIRSDATEEMDQAIKDALNKNRVLYKRLFNAFPRLKFSFDNQNKIIKGLRNRMDEIDKLLVEKKKEIRKTKEKIKKLKANKNKENEIKEEKKNLKNIRRRKI